ncbi:hypothetical protein GGQ79_000512 [Ochrobactrum pecoris]|uniref:Uncharacterized protein n=1 Tax=Brucella pecoris TaxID=867683 RepID=A0AB34YMK1_9HYPH|nr:hypothetical protein [Brucella pecoris]
MPWYFRLESGFAVVFVIAVCAHVLVQLIR